MKRSVSPIALMGLIWAGHVVVQSNDLAYRRYLR